MMPKFADEFTNVLNDFTCPHCGAAQDEPCADGCPTNTMVFVDDDETEEFIDLPLNI